MPTRPAIRTDTNEQERQHLLAVAAALRTAAPYLNREQRQHLCQTADRCIEHHRRTAHTAELAALIAQRDALTT